jgi:hypothetical protein
MCTTPVRLRAIEKKSGGCKLMSLSKLIRADAKNKCLVSFLFGSISLLIRIDAKCHLSHVFSCCCEQMLSQE